MRRILIAVAIGTIGIVIFGLLKGPPIPAPPSTFWQEPIPSQQLVADANYAGAIAAGRASLIERMQYFGTPGVSVAVAIRKEVVWAECFGYSDIESKQWVDPSTKFRVASVSKPFTVALIARLYEEGKIDLDAPVRTYLPNYPVKKYPFTCRQLAGHLSGVRYRKPFLNTRRYHSINEALQEFQGEPLLFPPGAKFHYSNQGYTILSAVAEAVTAGDYLSLMAERVFEPLQMTHTGPDLPGVSNVTVFYDNYTKRNHLPVIAPHHDNSRYWAAGGFLSTPLDMVKFANAHLSGGFFKPETITTLFTSQKTTDGKGTGYGIGWKCVPGPFGLREIRHLGDSVGSQAFLVLCPDVELVIALVCTGMFRNYHGDGTAGATNRLRSLFMRAIEEEEGR